MSTTTIRLPDELKDRVKRAAERAGTTSHAFMLDAITGRLDAEERRADFEAVAERRLAGIANAGQTVAWPDLRTYLRDRVRGKRPRRPAARTLAARKS